MDKTKLVNISLIYIFIYLPVDHYSFSEKKNMLKIFIFQFCLLITLGTIQAQSYIDAGGVRIGSGEFGFTYKRLIDNRWTIEGIGAQSINDRNKDLTLAILAENHLPLISRRLNLYYGLGLQSQIIGVSTDPNLKNGIGAAGIAGLDFTVGRLNLSYDIKPAFYFFGGRTNFDSQVALSLRYVFTKRVVKVDWSKLKFWDGWFKKKK